VPKEAGSVSAKGSGVLIVVFLGGVVGWGWSHRCCCANQEGSM